MNAGWKILLLSAAFLDVAFGAERILMPDVVPIGLTEEPQSLWSLEAAFVLRAIELMAAGLVIIASVIMLGAWVKSRFSRRLPTSPAD